MNEIASLCSTHGGIEKYKILLQIQRNKMELKDTMCKMVDRIRLSEGRVHQGAVINTFRFHMRKGILKYLSNSQFLKTLRHEVNGLFPWSVFILYFFLLCLLLSFPFSLFLSSIFLLLFLYSVHVTHILVLIELSISCWYFQSTSF